MSWKHSSPRPVFIFILSVLLSTNTHPYAVKAGPRASGDVLELSLSVSWMGSFYPVGKMTTWYPQFPATSVERNGLSQWFRKKILREDSDCPQVEPWTTPWASRRDWEIGSPGCPAWVITSHPCDWGDELISTEPYMMCLKEREDVMTRRNAAEEKQQMSSEGASCGPDYRLRAKCTKPNKTWPFLSCHYSICNFPLNQWDR